jgi:hypothetical protein
MADWPILNFDWLANLPKVADEARINKARQSLGDIDLNSPTALSKAATKFASFGDIDTAAKFAQLASQRQSAEASLLSAKQRGADIALWEKYMQSKAGAPGGVAAPAEPAADVSIGPARQVPPPQAAPPMGWGATIGPRSELPPGPPSPSDAILAQAQGAGPPPAPPGPQLAGPLPPPEAPPGPSPMAPGPGVGFIPPQQGLPVPPAPLAPAPPPRAGMPIKPADQLQGEATEVRVGKELMQMPPRSAGWPQFQVFKQKFMNALSQQKLTEKESAYQMDQVQRHWLGEEPQTRSEWEGENKTREYVFKQAHEFYTGSEKTAEKSTELLGTLRRLDQIRNSPGFISGEAGQSFASMMAGIAGIASVAGIPLTTGEDVGAFRARINKIAEPSLKSAALAEEFDALSKRALQAHVGSFAKSFSEGDRLFTEKYFPQVTASPGGIGAVIGDLRLMAEHAQGVAKTARDYMRGKERGSRATEWGLRQAIDAYNEKNPLYANPDGSLTPAGQRLQARAEGAPEAPPPPAPKHPQSGFIVKDKSGKPIGTVDDSGAFVPYGRGL